MKENEQHVLDLYAYMDLAHIIAHIDGECMDLVRVRKNLYYRNCSMAVPSAVPSYIRSGWVEMPETSS
jgi:hypothetical protein